MFDLLGGVLAGSFRASRGSLDHPVMTGAHYRMVRRPLEPPSNPGRINQSARASPAFPRTPQPHTTVLKQANPTGRGTPPEVGSRRSAK